MDKNCWHIQNRRPKLTEKLSNITGTKFCVTQCYLCCSLSNELLWHLELPHFIFITCNNFSFNIFIRFTLFKENRRVLFKNCILYFWHVCILNLDRTFSLVLIAYFDAFPWTEASLCSKCLS